MDIYPIKTEQDYQRALTDIESLMMAEIDTPDGDRLDVLVTLVEDYEQKHYPIDFPDPVEAIKFVMDQRSLTAKDLVPMIKKLHRDLGIPAESLLSLN